MQTFLNQRTAFHGIQGSLLSFIIRMKYGPGLKVSDPLTKNYMALLSQRWNFRNASASRKLHPWTWSLNHDIHNFLTMYFLVMKNHDFFFELQDRGGGDFLRVLPSSAIFDIIQEIHSNQFEHCGYKRVLEYVSIFIIQSVISKNC